MVRMSTYETLDADSIEDEYDMDYMEELELLSENNGDADSEPVESQDYWNTNPAFSDISAWEKYKPDNEFLGVREPKDDELFVGKLWDSKDEARSSVEKYSISRGVEFKTDRSNHNCVIYVCKSGGENCPWEVKVLKKRKSSFWELVKYKGDHTCRSTTIPSDIIHLNKKQIANKYQSRLKATLRLEPLRIQADVQNDFGYKISYLKAWQAKQLAMENVFGNWEESFSQLPQMMEVVQSKNPGTFVKWDTTAMSEGYHVINRVFWAFGPAITAFEHCRPVLSIDGTHLYGKYNGRLLVAIALDANNQLLPLAFALVESENTSSWKWFMSCIREGVTQRDGLCIISDRHNGILASMNTLDGWRPPRAYHRYCIRHLKSNLNTKLKYEKTLKQELGRIGYISDIHKFDIAYAEFLKHLEKYPEVREWMMNLPLEIGV